MVVNECIWKCMKLCDGIGMHMMVYGCISAHMDLYESIWYMNVNGSKWMYMKVYEALWWYTTAYESEWMYMSQYNGIWKYVIVYECVGDWVQVSTS